MTPKTRRGGKVGSTSSPTSRSPRSRPRPAWARARTFPEHWVRWSSPGGILFRARRAPRPRPWPARPSTGAIRSFPIKAKFVVDRRRRSDGLGQRGAPSTSNDEEPLSSPRCTHGEARRAVPAPLPARDRPAGNYAPTRLRYRREHRSHRHIVQRAREIAAAEALGERRSVMAERAARLTAPTPPQGPRGGVTN